MPEPQASSLLRLYQDWNIWRRGRELPARPDFDPCDLKYVLGNLSLVDVLYDPIRFRYRLYASNVAEKIGRDLTGKFLEEFPDKRQATVAREHYLEVLKARTPVAKIYHLVTDLHEWNCEILVLPLSNAGADIDMMMTCFAWEEILPTWAKKL